MQIISIVILLFLLSVVIYSIGFSEGKKNTIGSLTPHVEYGIYLQIKLLETQGILKEDSSDQEKTIKSALYYAAGLETYKASRDKENSKSKLSDE